MKTKHPKNTVKIMVFGTFDGLHEGHINFFKQARSLSKGNTGAHLIVSVARDKNVKKIKGKLPHLNEKKRKKLVKNSGLADKIVLGGIKNHLPHIVSERPDIIALGYDQKAYVKGLRADLAEKNLKARVVRLKPYKKNIYKNHLLRRLTGMVQ